MKPYKIVDTTYFLKDTDETVCKILNDALKSDERLKLYYGDTETGRDWCGTNDVAGYIGRTTGPHKSPILLPNKNSIGGSLILTDSIVKIKNLTTKKVVYQIPNYQTPKIEIKPNETLPPYKFEVWINGELSSRFKTDMGAKKFENKLL